LKDLSTAYVRELKLLDPKADDDLVRAEVEDYVADAYGAYVLGPAFACAAIYLRLSPPSASVATVEHYYDDGRAHIMLGILDLMATVPEPAPEFRLAADELRTVWRSLEDHGNRAQSSGGDESKTKAYGASQKKEVLNRLIGELWREFESGYISESRYPYYATTDAYAYNEEGWSVAKEWSSDWIRQLKNRGELRPPANISFRNGLRDALNAAWKARIEYPDPFSVISIASVASSLCQIICTKHREGATSGAAPSRMR
jgi:hypothetical protein